MSNDQIQKSESIGNLATALAVAQGKFHNAAKSARAHHGNYADLAAIMDAIREPLSENGLAITQLVSTDDAGISVTTILMHKSGEWIASTLTMKPTQAGPQNVGIVISYARRYAVSAMVALASEEDTDGNEVQTQQQQPRGPQRVASTSTGTKATVEETKKQADAEKKEAPGKKTENPKDAMLRKGIREQLTKINEDTRYPKVSGNAHARALINTWLSSQGFGYEVANVDEVKPEHLPAMLAHFADYEKWMEV
jgi:ERF superfamily protein